MAQLCNNISWIKEHTEGISEHYSRQDFLNERRKDYERKQLMTAPAPAIQYTEERVNSGHTGNPWRFGEMKIIFSV